jgi:hypothetical protein
VGDCCWKLGAPTLAWGRFARAGELLRDLARRSSVALMRASSSSSSAALELRVCFLFEEDDGQRLLLGKQWSLTGRGGAGLRTSGSELVRCPRDGCWMWFLALLIARGPRLWTDRTCYLGLRRSSARWSWGSISHCFGRAFGAMHTTQGVG